MRLPCIESAEKLVVSSAEMLVEVRKQGDVTAESLARTEKCIQESRELLERLKKRIGKAEKS